MKNDILNMKRFGNYFAADFRNGISNFGLSALTCSLVGIAAFFLCGIFGIISGQGWVFFPAAGRLTIFVIMLVVCLIVGPVKLYGHLTEKKAGSFFLSIPASSFEKHASMIINSAIIFPLIICVLYCAVDGILCLVAPACGDSLIRMCVDGLSTFHEFVNNNIPEELSRVAAALNPVMYIDDVIQIALIFLLGAICFKKSKAAKTILVLIALSIISSSIMSPILFHGIGTIAITNDAEAIDFLTNKVGWLFNNLVLIDWISDTVVNCALAAGIYFRVKTLKF